MQRNVHAEVTCTLKHRQQLQYIYKLKLQESKKKKKMLRLGNFKSETCMNTSKTEKHFRNYFAMGGKPHREIQSKFPLVPKAS